MCDTDIKEQYDTNKKSVKVAYILWFFLCTFGAHRFYLKKVRTATMMLAITILSIILYLVGLGFYTFPITGIWAIVDLFLIPGMARKHNSKLVKRFDIQTSTE